MHLNMMDEEPTPVIGLAHPFGPLGAVASEQADDGIAAEAHIEFFVDLGRDDGGGEPLGAPQLHHTGEHSCGPGGHAASRVSMI